VTPRKKKTENKDDGISEETIKIVVDKIKNQTIHNICIFMDKAIIKVNSTSNSSSNNNNNSNIKEISNNKDNNEDIVVEDTPLLNKELVESIYPDNDTSILNEDVEDFLPEFEKNLFSVHQQRVSNDSLNSKYNFKQIFNYYIILIILKQNDKNTKKFSLSNFNPFD